MSNASAAKAKSAWTEKERLTYLFALLETSNRKFDFANTPRPAGRSIIACQRMVERMRITCKADLEGGQGVEGKKGGTSRKRKIDEDGAEAMPKKRGKKKVQVQVDAETETDKGDGGQVKDEEI